MSNIFSKHNMYLLHVHISDQDMVEQIFHMSPSGKKISNPKKRITKQTKGRDKFLDNLYGKHPRGRKYDSSHGRR